MAELLPSGLRRGATVSVTGSTSLLLLLLAGAMTGTDLWSAVVGEPNLGLVAAVELGVPLERLALVPRPGPDLPTVVGALVDGLSLVAVTVPAAGVSAATARILSGRARSRGCTLIVGAGWPGIDLAIGAKGHRWVGLGQGRGRVRYCDLDVEVRGRGSAVRPRRLTIRLPRAQRMSAASEGRGGAVESRARDGLGRIGEGGATPLSSPWQARVEGLVGLPEQERQTG
ncbi:hypothetical protein [Plantactinospora sp. CA-290183]|uniref:hypothetical protein n=1 Tax=Plantactinospora sp. CA-290183 TaxID=3240006 RepID=UPI003D90925B